MTDTATVLVLPGYQNSGPAHWQSHWEQEHPAYLRVEQEDWDAPQLDSWVATLDRAVALAPPGPVVLVAHSLGCITVAHWATRQEQLAGQVSDGQVIGRQVIGALLVAPADIDTVDIAELKNFRPVPLRPLPFPSIVVSSSNDPYADPERSRLFAESWGSRLVALGSLGHINSDSAMGSWPEGQALLAELLATAG
ncbi:MULTISPECIES: RBBP9/YdeN family alpha/beta hydrolase [unclassified Kitasatospora]|uniref:RBBP9/YdeN family alpha/beta hydrolase n=1 Tax=unclassified Kitasatospora TaxID=2633591 RepID=UPI002473EFDA|nr:alpha/beta hydrolase [Kitasatospora sp. MAP12-44]